MMAAKKVSKKIVVLGDPAVGKTSLIRRFVINAFDDKYLTTIGAKIVKKEVQLSRALPSQCVPCNAHRLSRIMYPSTMRSR